VPAEIIEDRDALCAWAVNAMDCQIRGPHPNPLPLRGRGERRK
jgi:hypothetical protein